jgi:hypothetical protein
LTTPSKTVLISTMKLTLGWISALSLAALLVGPASVAGGQTPDKAEPPPGEGVMCALAIYGVVEQVGRRCFPGQDASMQAEIGRSVTKLDRYVLANGWTAKDLARFKRDQTWVDEPTDKLCKGDPADLYRAMTATDPAELRAGVDAQVSRPGKPSWGDCL